MRIEQRLEAKAPCARVWSVVCDLDAYPAWSPFVVSCRSTLEVGAPIDMRVRVLPGLAQPQRERILEHQPGRRLCYGLEGAALGAFTSRRVHEVQPIDEGRTLYVSQFELSGWLEPVVRRVLGRRLAAGFLAMSHALVERAEHLAKQRDPGAG